MGYENCGSNPNSKANLWRGHLLPGKLIADEKARELAREILSETTVYDDKKMTLREAILREQIKKAMTGDLRSCQFLIDLAIEEEKKGEAALQGVTGLVDPLIELKNLMQESKLDRRRIKANSQGKSLVTVEKNSQKSGQNMSQKICTTQ